MTFTKEVNPRLIKTFTTSLMGDTHTPVSIFLKLRDKYKSILMLEANDFTSKEDCKSYIALDILDEFVVKHGHICLYELGECVSRIPISAKNQVVEALQEFITSHESSEDSVFNGCFGHTNFEAIEYFEDIDLNKEKESADIPAIRYSTFKYILEFVRYRFQCLNHFHLS